jgi:nitroimidazol reductase NimA-like FMN-containing flavoprotein (pyridoxamine 5'-phosphate oxidase superfamily)
MPEAKLRELLAELFDSQRSAVLATQGGGQPYCSLMAFAATGDLRDLLFATLRATRK